MGAFEWTNLSTFNPRSSALPLHRGRWSFLPADTTKGRSHMRWCLYLTLLLSPFFPPDQQNRRIQPKTGDPTPSLGRNTVLDPKNCKVWLTYTHVNWETSWIKRLHVGIGLNEMLINRTSLYFSFFICHIWLIVPVQPTLCDYYSKWRY